MQVGGEWSGSEGEVWRVWGGEIGRRKGVSPPPVRRQLKLEAVEVQVGMRVGLGGGREGDGGGVGGKGRTEGRQAASLTPVRRWKRWRCRQGGGGGSQREELSERDFQEGYGGRVKQTGGQMAKQAETVNLRKCCTSVGICLFSHSIPHLHTSCCLWNRNAPRFLAPHPPHSCPQTCAAEAIPLGPHHWHGV